MKLVVAVAFLVSAASAWAQAPDQEALKANLKKKLDAGFLKSSPWITDYAKAKETAKKENKAIFAYFTRSYAN